jgi:hypothetical protein
MVNSLSCPDFLPEEANRPPQWQAAANNWFAFAL